MLNELTYEALFFGGKRLLVDGVKRTVSFSPDNIELLIGKNLYEVSGEELTISYIGDGVVEIEGRIDSFGRKGK